MDALSNSLTWDHEKVTSVDWRFLTLAFDDVGGKKAGPRPVIDKNVADGHEGFVEFGGNLHDRHPGWDVIVGRQEVLFGTGRLLDNNEGVNVRGAFDGIRAGYDKPKGRIDLIAVKPVETNPGVWDDIIIKRQLIINVTRVTYGATLTISPFCWSNIFVGIDSYGRASNLGSIGCSHSLGGDA